MTSLHTGESHCRPACSTLSWTLFRGSAVRSSEDRAGYHRACQWCVDGRSPSARPDPVTLDRYAEWISVTWRYVIAEALDRLPDSS
ncbi:hypothetical protein Forpe1208_v015792 [Fusarium oxysporum f. sp. rapae]|uniref:Uncharacterized protein n=1 Tax=Fusarium oxysporum f. sp. rapae TaxID=485398 RepID=A0A8J5NKH0_FUSOX|nr:hypothetical protein Forpe1208_v015792 [Fusarium oxysporum f. sp. rapae]